METKKISTYIEGLDDVLGGGFPVGHVVLLSGLPGTMKSTLSYAILHGNARERGAKCLYVSLEQTRKSLEGQMAAMGFDVEAVRGDVHILDVGTIQKEIGKSADRKSTRLNSSHLVISYAVFCLKKKKKQDKHLYTYTKSLRHLLVYKIRHE